jgi:hypothetical protein
MPRIGVANPRSLSYDLNADWLSCNRPEVMPPEWRGMRTFFATALAQTIGDYLSKEYFAIEDVEGRNGNGIFSFEHLCKFLKLDPGCVKDRLKTMTLKDWRRAISSSAFGLCVPLPPIKRKIWTVCQTCKKRYLVDKRSYAPNKFCSPECRRGHTANMGRHRKRNEGASCVIGFLKKGETR